MTVVVIIIIIIKNRFLKEKIADFWNQWFWNFSLHVLFLNREPNKSQHHTDFYQKEKFNGDTTKEAAGKRALSLC